MWPRPPARWAGLGVVTKQMGSRALSTGCQCRGEAALGLRFLQLASSTFVDHPGPFFPRRRAQPQRRTEDSRGRRCSPSGRRESRCYSDGSGRGATVFRGGEEK
ncbi:hypothetical protein SRHO_G00202060 [Serrasalmus rhombeus]